MKFVTYFASSGDISQFSEKFLLLRYFAEGVERSGDMVIQHLGSDYIESDVALIQGWCTDPKHLSVNNQVRRSVIEQQLARNRYVISADSNLFLYAVGKQNSPHHYLRYSFNGIFANTGIYCDLNPDPDRWKKIQTDLKIQVKPYRTSGSHILILLQRDGGWSMKNQPVLTWLTNTLDQIRRHSDRPIIIRPHPGDKRIKTHLNQSFFQKNFINPSAIKISENTDLISDLKNSWVVVNHNSSAVVGAAIEGYPVFVTDPDASQCADIANKKFSKIENPVLPDRQSWLERISQFHWNFSELQSGECWRHMRRFIDPAVLKN